MVWPPRVSPTEGGHQDIQDAVQLLRNHAGVYGDGSDGDATISAETLLTRDMFYNDLTITSTGILRQGGMRAFCKGTLTVETGGVIKRDGGNASGNVGGGMDGAGQAGNQAVLYGSDPGGVHGNTPGGVTGWSVDNSLGGNGGSGGAGSGAAGGAGGVAVRPSVLGKGGSGGARYMPLILLGSTFSTINNETRIYPITGGAWGGSGGAPTGGVFSGGGGGGPGFPMQVIARNIVNSGRISSNGGKGGDVGADGGSGGGGGGGVIWIICETYQGNTPEVFGGQGGTILDGTGVAGSAGSSGTVINIASLILP